MTVADKYYEALDMAERYTKLLRPGTPLTHRQQIKICKEIKRLRKYVEDKKRMSVARFFSPIDTIEITIASKLNGSTVKVKI